MTQLAQYPRIRAALAEAAKIEEILPIIDEIEHVRLYAKQIEDQELLADAAEYQMRAERRLGDILGAAKAAGHFAEGRRKKPKNGTAEEPFQPATLEEVGVSKKLSSRAQKRSGIALAAFEAMIGATRARIASGHANVMAEQVNGARSIMGSRIEPGDSLDYFPTPPWATRALMECVWPVAVPSGKVGTVWEPACGEGHIAEVLSEYADAVIATDIHDYGYGQAPLDFLGELPPNMRPDWIITNPPFGDEAEAFVIRAIDMAQVGCAMFLRLQWLESVGRYQRIFSKFPPTLIAQFCERVPLHKGRWEPEGATATAYLWIVWLPARQSARGLTEFFWIPPGQREALTKPNDVERFTTHPVTKAIRHTEVFDTSTGELAPEPQRGAA
jgi:hypothetical protein